MTKTYEELSTKLNEGMNIFSLVQRKTRTLLQMMNNNSKKISSTKAIDRKISLLDEQIKLLAGLIMKRRDDKSNAMNEITDEENAKNGQMLKEIEQNA